MLRTKPPAAGGGPRAPLPLYALLKLVAFDDRKAPKDLAGVFHCLQHYVEDDERRHGAEHDGEGVPYEGTVVKVLNRFPDVDADVIGVIARERGRIAPTDDERTNIFELFRWYRLGGNL